MKYNHTLSQKLERPFLWLFWKFSTIPKKKSWHEVMKGMEKHTCNFTIPFTEQGYKFLRCNHEGCYIADPVD